MLWNDGKVLINPLTFLLTECAFKWFHCEESLKCLIYNSTKLIWGWLQFWKYAYTSFSSWLEVESLFTKRGGFGPHYPKHADSVLRFFLTHLPVLALKRKDKRKLLLSRSLIRKKILYLSKYIYFIWRAYSCAPSDSPSFPSSRARISPQVVVGVQLMVLWDPSLEEGLSCMLS